MTKLTKPVTRATNGTLDGSFGSDRHKRIVITIIPGNGVTTPDTISLRPERTQRAETLAVIDIYRYAMRCRLNSATLEKARQRKAKLIVKRATARADAAERRFRAKIGGSK